MIDEYIAKKPSYPDARIDKIRVLLIDAVAYVIQTFPVNDKEDDNCKKSKQTKPKCVWLCCTCESLSGTSSAHIKII